MAEEGNCFDTHEHCSGERRLKKNASRNDGSIQAFFDRYRE
jgi:hypothetical protein